MVKLFALASLVLLVPGPDVRFEKDGVRIGDALVQGAVVELQNGLLASGNSVEALHSAIDIRVADGRTLTLEPGIRVARAAGGFRIGAHSGRGIRFATPEKSFLAAGPVEVTATAEGWTVGEAAVSGSSLRVGLERQDEESNLDKMLKDKEKMRGTGTGRPSTRTTRLFRGDPMTQGNAANSIGVRLIPQISPSGAP
jgi:hypothetical protein